MGVPVEVLRIQPHPLQQASDLGTRLGLSGADAVEDQWLGEGLVDRPPGVQAAERVLEDDLHLPPVGHQIRPGATVERLAVEVDLSFGWLN